MSHLIVSDDVMAEIEAARYDLKRAGTTPPPAEDRDALVGLAALITLSLEESR